MQAKLTLRLEERLIVRAKAWARKRGVSLSQAVATLFEQLPRASTPTLAPWTQKLVGAGGHRKKSASDEAIRRNHMDRLHAPD
jgi:Family of unknown function (DUF6364)